MDDDAKQVGRRVRCWRLRRNLDRKQFADMVGRSTSWLDKIEKGERGLARLPLLERVAGALSVDPTALTDGAIAERVSHCVDVHEVAAIRTALSRYPNLTGPSDRPVAVPILLKQAAYLDQAWLSSHFTVVARRLPQLMADAQVTALAVPARDQVAAYRLLVTTFRMASSMLLKFETNDLAWMAADRAMHSALAVSDTWSLARATRSVARAMTSAGQQASAIAVLVDMADRMRPELRTDSRDLLALYGMVHLAASITAADQEDGQLARDMHQEALAAAERMTSEHRTHATLFGMSNVLIHRVAVLLRRHEAGRALEFAATIDPSRIALLPPERQANFLLDLTDAHTRTGDYRAAVRRLGEAELVAPEEVRCRPLAHGLLRSLLNSTTGEPARLVRAMAGRAGVRA